MSNIKIGIAGLGTVGQGVFKILSAKSDMLENRCRKKLEVIAVSARNKSSDRGIDISGVKWYDEAVELADDDNIDIVIELIGGADGVAYDLCKNALKNGKHVVTANKALIAIHGGELAKLAEENNVSLCFEAAVAGGIPILKSIREGLAANEFTKVSGIMNGTCNYILTEMESGGRAFDDVLADAQKLGYAETPPDLDIDGIDTAHKLAIITALAYSCSPDFDSIYIDGIRNISLDDIEYAQELGYKIKLLGIASCNDNKIEQRVHSCLIADDIAIANVDGVLNAVQVECDSLGDALFTGAGAGAKPTASSVIADIMDIASNRNGYPFGVAASKLEHKEFISIAEHSGEYYIRFCVKDESGVLASITALLSEENIGVEKVLQKPCENSGTAQIAITTHKTNEQSIIKTLNKITDMYYTVKTPHMIRIERF